MDMIATVPKKFKASETQNNVIVHLPSYHKVRYKLSRHRINSCMSVPDPLFIPDALKTTLRGLEAPDDDPLKDERFLL